MLLPPTHGMFSSERVTRTQHRRSATRNMYIDARLYIWQQASFELCSSARLERGLSYHCLILWHCAVVLGFLAFMITCCCPCLPLGRTRTCGKLTLTGGSTRLVATRSQILRFRSFFLDTLVLAETITCMTRADITNPGFRTSRNQQRAGHHRSRMAELWISIRSCMQSAPTWVIRV